MTERVLVEYERVFTTLDCAQKMSTTSSLYTRSIDLSHMSNYYGARPHESDEFSSFKGAPYDDGGLILAADFNDLFTPDMLYNLPVSSSTITNEDILSLLSQPAALPAMFPSPAPAPMPPPPVPMRPAHHSPVLNMAPPPPPPRPAPPPQQARTQPVAKLNDTMAVKAEPVEGGEHYVFAVDAPVSIAQRREDNSLTYINKGQYYTMRGKVIPSKNGLRRTPVRTSVFVMFRDDTQQHDAEGYWRYWRSQHGLDARALEVDMDNCVGATDFVATSFNGVEFMWTPANGCVVPIRVNCLSTDFTSQKGVKGIPLKIQVDVYEAYQPEAPSIYRAFCHIKVFRDKGAERKNKDERKNAEKRLQKYYKEAESRRHGESAINDPFYAPSDHTTLTAAPLAGPKPTEIHARMVTHEAVVKREYLSPQLPRSRRPGEEHAGPMARSASLSWIPPPSPGSPLSDPGLIKQELLNAGVFGGAWPGDKKRSLMTVGEESGSAAESDGMFDRNARVVKRRGPSALTVYVRKEEEEAYNALYLEDPCVAELKKQICQLYSLDVNDVKRVFKRTKKGLLVKLEDHVVARLGDESDFKLEVSRPPQYDGLVLILIPGEGIE